MGRTIAELSTDAVKLMQFLIEQKPGTDLSYFAIEHQTGVTMDSRGRQLLRAALKRLRLEYSTRHNYGIVLADASMVMPILSSKISSIDRAVKRGDQTQRNLQEQFFNSLAPEEQRQVLFAGAVFGAIRLAAEQGQLLYQKKDRIELPAVRIELPRLG